MGRVKYSFFPKKDIQGTNILRFSKSKAPIMGKRYLLTSYNVKEVTKRAPRGDNGNVTLMGRGAKQDFILHFANAQIVVSSQYQGANYVCVCTHVNTQ